MILNRFRKHNKTAFDYSWTEYFSILVDQLSIWREVLSIIAEKEKKVLPHMEVHLERIDKIWWNTLIERIDNILTNPHPDLKWNILNQLNIFKTEIIKNIEKRDNI